MEMQEDDSTDRNEFDFVIAWLNGMAELSFNEYERQLQDQLDGKVTLPDGNNERWNLLFNTKFAMIPGFRMYIIKELARSGNAQSRTKFLLRSIFATMIKTKGVKTSQFKMLNDPNESENVGNYIKKLQGKYKNKDGKVSDRQFRRLISQYEPLFYKIGGTSTDGRNRRYSSTFSQNASQYSQVHDISKQAADHFLNEVLENEGYQFYTQAIAPALVASPDYLRDLMRFRDLCKDLLADINTEDEKEGGILVRISKELANLSIIEGIKTDIEGITSNEWFMKLSERKKHELMDRGFHWFFTDADLDRTVSILEEQDEQFSYETLLQAGVSLSYHSLSSSEYVKIAERTLLESLRFATSALNTTSSYISLSELCIFTKQYSNGVEYAEKALELAEKSSLRYERALALIFLGQNKFLKGDKQEGLQRLNIAIDSANTLSDMVLPRNAVPTARAMAVALKTKTADEMKDLLLKSTGTKDILNYLLGASRFIRNCGFEIKVLRKLMSLPETTMDEYLRLSTQLNKVTMSCTDFSEAGSPE